MAEEVQPVEPAAEIQVTAGDLATMVRIIDASSQRGAFRGEELETVGALRTKLATIVNALAPKTEEGEGKGDDAVEGGDDSIEPVVEDVVVEEEKVVIEEDGEKSA